MKRGKDEEKVMGPMFPRLHVNDTEKGGPRAPPRNKMALYEQLSIPSQRFKHGVVPISSSSTANVTPPASSSQGGAQQKAVLFSLQLPHSSQLAEKVDSHHSDSNAPLMQLEQKKKSEDDDFRVPIFTQSSMLQDSVRLPTSDTVPRQVPVSGRSIRHEDRSHQNEENLKDLMASREQSIRAVLDSSSIKDIALRQNNTCLHRELGDNPVNTCSGLPRTGNSLLLPENRVDSNPTCRVNSDAIINGPTRGQKTGDSSVSMWNYQSGQRILDDTESREDKTCRSLPTGIADTDRDDDTSETSMVDCISELDITPDDVVGIIGQKHFWKARRAISNQQRVFAVQVFELHRLIKVQKLIAGSPNLLIESNSYLGKPIKASSPKKIPLNYTVKGPSNAAKPGSEKPNDKEECSAENTVGKASLSSVQNGSHLPSYKQFSANSPITPGDQTFGSWCFHQPQGHQWLVPVMSPSEGLVYKPYPGPGFMAPACGGCGPPGAAPMMDNFLTPAYGVPAAHHYQGMGVPPFAAPAGPHGYFSPYGMPVMNPANSGSAVDQINQFAPSGFHGQSPGAGTNSNIQQQNSTNVPGQKNRADGVTPDVVKLHASRDSELQVSTASSPSERSRGIGRANSMGATNVLSLFPTSPVIDVPSSTIQPQDIDQPARVIKVVPHNGRSATEYVARIFQSIQEERKQHDSV